MGVERLEEGPVVCGGDVGDGLGGGEGEGGVALRGDVAEAEAALGDDVGAVVVGEGDAIPKSGGVREGVGVLWGCCAVEGGVDGEGQGGADGGDGRVSFEDDGGDDTKGA